MTQNVWRVSFSPLPIHPSLSGTLIDPHPTPTPPTSNSSGSLGPRWFSSLRLLRHKYFIMGNADFVMEAQA